MRVLFLASEATPFIKTGGLADVVGTLPRALREFGLKPAVMLPLYRQISEEYKARMKEVASFTVELGWRKHECKVFSLMRGYIKYYFIANDFYFDRDYVYANSDSDAERFIFFCRAALEALEHLRLYPDVIHCNDWHTGIVPLLLKSQYAGRPYHGAKCVFTIHNLRYQGVFDRQYIQDITGIDDSHFNAGGLEYFGKANLMKAGIVYADAINTVSPTYAGEIQTPEYGENLDGLLRSRSNVLRGILNGIDVNEYNPIKDKTVPFSYDYETIELKKQNKRALQEELGLEQRDDVPLIGMVSRLTEQKGFSLIAKAYDELMRMDIQLVTLGSGEPWMESMFRTMHDTFPHKSAFWAGQNEPLARRIYAGVDMFLMPSMFEPCGISQLIAMRYGTIPVVRETGGLKDSVLPYNAFTGEGTGITFAGGLPEDMLGAIRRALDCYHKPNVWQGLIKHAMAADFSWSNSAKLYSELYVNLL